MSSWSYKEHYKVSGSINRMRHSTAVALTNAYRLLEVFFIVKINKDNNDTCSNNNNNTFFLASYTEFMLFYNVCINTLSLGRFFVCLVHGFLCIKNDTNTYNVRLAYAQHLFVCSGRTTIYQGSHHLNDVECSSDMQKIKVLLAL